jgi:hypothetical protein
VVDVHNPATPRRFAELQGTRDVDARLNGETTQLLLIVEIRHPQTPLISYSSDVKVVSDPPTWRARQDVFKQPVAEVQLQLVSRHRSSSPPT